MIARLEDERTPPRDEHDKQVKDSNEIEKHFFPSGFDQKFEETVTDISLWILHG